MSSTTILAVTTVIMFAGGLIILLTGKRRTPAEETHTVCHGIVPIIAACSYFAMAVGQGSTLLHNEAAPEGVTRIFYFARYVDWSDRQDGGVAPVCDPDVVPLPRAGLAFCDTQIT